MSIINFIKSKLKRLENSQKNFPTEHIKSYYQSRTISDTRYLCHAPFNNMYFNSVGDVANCWLTFDNPEKYSEERTIKEIWFGKKFSDLRENIKNFDLSSRCGTCLNYIKNGNYVNVLAKAYDNEYPISDFPTMMEFELTNTCNLECTMCTGLLSSSIRANREKLPKLKSPYGAKFVSELEEFIPYLHEARFNGGEPFLIKIYYDIWERIIKINPKCKIVVATNGTILTQKVKDVMAKGNFHINISIDSLIEERYSQIRINGDLKKVLENFIFFKDYCNSNKRSLCVMINPMKNNWDEMPAFVSFCNQNNVHLWFNTIVHPEDLSIWKLSYDELCHIFQVLSNVRFDRGETPHSLFTYNTKTYHNLVNNQIQRWLEDSKSRMEIEVNQENDKEAFLKKVGLYCEEKNLIQEYNIFLKNWNEFESLVGEQNQMDMIFDSLLKLPVDQYFKIVINETPQELFNKYKAINVSG